MAEPLRPDPAKVFARKNYIYVPTVASATLAPTVAEATAASSLDITRIAFVGAEPSLNATQERVRMSRRIGDDGDFEGRGVVSYEGGDIVMAVNSQAAALSDGKKAWEKFQPGTTGFVAKRSNVVRATAVAAGQFLIYVMPVEFGQPIPLEQGEGSAAEEAFTVPFFITGEPKFMVAVLT